MGSHHENSAGNKSKKTWGERLKIGVKPDKKREERSPSSPVSPDRSYLLEEYRTKYGTLSSGSALSKSMKYAETWLYGSVAVRQPSKDSNPRPSLLLYHHIPPPVAVIPTPQAVVFPQATKYAVVVCSCPEFITGTARSKKGSSATCKKCGGSRTFWNVNKAGTVRGMTTAGNSKCADGTIRVGTVETSNSIQQPLKATTPDPYDLMRRNRLGVIGTESQARYEVLETSGLDTMRIRAKSTSPCRRRRSPSPPMSGNTGLRTSRKDMGYNREFSRWNSAMIASDNNKRKSILECDVNAYELIAKYLKNGNKPPRINKDGMLNKQLERQLSDDDILEDDLSDDLSDNALENASSTRRRKTFSTFKTDNNHFLEENTNVNSIKSTTSVEKSSSPSTRPVGITLGGQRIKIFNGQNHSPNDSGKSQDNDKTNDNSEENNKTNSRQQTPVNSNTSPSLIPRLSSPRRPPRKIKSTTEIIGSGINGNSITKQESDEKEKESGGDDVRGSSPSLLTQTRDARYTSSTEGAIKSILKKPTLSPADTFSDTVSAGSASCHSPSPADADGAKEFYLPTFQEFKQKIKKKKQVQFKVTNDVTVLGPLAEEEEEEGENEEDKALTDSETIKKCNFETQIETCEQQDEEISVKSGDEIESQQRKELNITSSDIESNDSGNCDAVKTGDVNEICNVKLSGNGDVTVKTEIVENSAKDCDVRPVNSTDTAPPQDVTQDTAALPASSNGENSVKDQGSVVTLRRSQSERLLPTSTGSLRGCDSKVQNCVNFNDTMRLRTRPGRPDIRQVFSDPGAPGPYGNTNVPKRMLSPGRPRPKEPPPPPPPPSFEFMSGGSDPRLPELPPRQIFPFTKKQIEQMNSQVRKKSHASASKGKKSFDKDESVPSDIRPVSWSPHSENGTQDKLQAENISIVKKKEHRHSDPGVVNRKLIVHVDKFPQSHKKDSAIQTESDLEDNLSYYEKKQSNSLPKMTSRIGGIKESKDKTIVTVSSSVPGSPLADVHRLHIKTEDAPVNLSPERKRRTSIIIMNDESPVCVNTPVQSINSPVKNDNTNKVTICVGGDSNRSPIELNSNMTRSVSSSFTLVDTSSMQFNSCEHLNQNSSSFTVFSSSKDVSVIPVIQEPVQRTLLVVDHNDSNKRTLKCWIDNNDESMNSDNKVLEKVESGVDVNDIPQESSSNIILTCRSRGMDANAAPDEKDNNILMNPVEAVKRNLIPHVCGKKSESNDCDSTEPSAIERLDKLTEMDIEIDDNDTETMKEGDYCMAAVASKLLEISDNSPLYSNIPSTPNTNSRSSEDTLPTVLEHGEEEEEDEVFEKMDSPNEVLETDNCIENKQLEETNYNSLESDKAPSSTEIENEGTEGSDIDNTSTSQSLSENLEKEKDNIEEVEAGEENTELGKESQVEGEEDNIYESIKDPIYEEIPDTPPPLPLSPPPSLDELEECRKTSRSIFEGASKYDILSYLVGAKERGIVPEESYYNLSQNGEEIVEIIDVKPIQEDIGESQAMNSLELGDLSSRVSHLSNASDSSEDSCNLMISNISDTPSPNKVRKSSAEIERNDSGVGSETSKSSRSRWQHCGPGCSIREDQQNLCEDCDQLVETRSPAVTESGVMFAPLVCRKCGKKRAERKEIIAEIVETEEKYGRDLQIIMDEFYKPMLVAGLLTPEQLSAIFLNVEELLEHNAALAEKLRDNLEIALEQGDEDLLTVNIGKLLLEATPMLHAFESYCTRQAAASLLLANLEKDKELLRIFLRVSQMENTVLRRMNLNSFLMVPVQRVTKYPLLLARLHKVTPAHHEGRELLKEAQHKIELHLEHMNSEAKDISTTKLWRRISIMNGRRAYSETDLLNIKLRKVALDLLEWNHDEVKFIMEGKLLYTNPADNNWRKSRTIKLNSINALLVVNGKLKEDYRLDPTEESLMFPRNNGVREATLVLLKEKCGRYIQLREPLFLDKCIVCSETDSDEYFEVQELTSRETFIFKAEDSERTKQWYKTCQYIAQGMGAWRRRRNALANIMINGMQIRN
ncbi:hypothetical protein L9F63_013648 [Diploptera punctata]|uniref:Myosin-M heavy chain n=1 Tax=Diploptera punctata TaxID=6984 RepID=A0AAD8AAF3_DIPPU|nr:hypothetical protein L9F63_013648 [Diploptera punctata]